MSEDTGVNTGSGRFVKRALRADGNGGLYLVCGCGRHVSIPVVAGLPMTYQCECGVAYDSQGWIQPEVISTYTDGQAVEDGFLVAINGRDRVSRPLYDWVVARAPEKPPNCWPIDLMGFCSATRISKTDALKLIAKYGKDEAQKHLNLVIADKKAVAMFRGLIDTRRDLARRVYDENIGGGILSLWPVTSGTSSDVIVHLADKDPGELKVMRARKIWLMPNELGGMTLMFPEDY